MITVAISAAFVRQERWQVGRFRRNGLADILSFQAHMFRLTSALHPGAQFAFQSPRIPEIALQDRPCFVTRRCFGHGVG